MVVRNMDKIISLMITAVMTVTSCSFKGENPLDGKRIAFIGDSISYGTNWQGGYGKLFGDQYNMNVTNVSMGGATLADYVHWSENSDGYRPYITDMLDNLDGDYEYIIAEFGGEPVAYVCFGELPDAREGTFEIFWLSTLNSFRGCGIGHQLFSRLSEILKERDAQKLYVKTDNTDQYYPTRKFYEKCGFRREAVLKEYYDRKDDCCIYGMDFAKEEEQYLEAAEY